MNVLSSHQALMFTELVYPFHIVTETPKSITFMDEEKNELEPMKGYFAIKDYDGKKIKYFLDEPLFNLLPIKINHSETLLYKDNSRVDSIVTHPVNLEDEKGNIKKDGITPFRIRPERMFPDMHKFIDNIAPFEHSNIPFFTLNKVNAIMGYVGKTMTCICGPSDFGKTSMYEILHSITQKCPVFQPRSVPGVLAQITEDGNMTIDEMQKAEAEIIRLIENFTMQLGDGRPIYHNGALKSAITRNNYRIAEQSLSFTYNTWDYYMDPDTQFFDNIWANKTGMDSRLVKFKVEGHLLEKFDKEFDIVAEAQKNKMMYMNIAKQLLWLKQIRLSNGYKRKYEVPFIIKLNERKRSTLSEITWLLDMYCDSKKEYEDYIGLIEKSMLNYAQMVGKTLSYNDIAVEKEEKKQQVIEEEIIEDSPPSPCHICGNAKSVLWDGLHGICGDCNKAKDVNRR